MPVPLLVHYHRCYSFVLTVPTGTLPFRTWLIPSCDDSLYSFLSMTVGVFVFVCTKHKPSYYIRRLSSPRETENIATAMEKEVRDEEREKPFPVLNSSDCFCPPPTPFYCTLF